MDVIRFGAFELDGRSLELRKAGRRVALAPQPARALAYLVSRAGDVVTKESLSRHVWNDGTHVDAEAGLHTIIKQVRLALGDDSRSPRFVETLPRRGYRFVGPVAVERHRPTGPRIVGIAAAALLIVSIAVGGWSMLSRSKPASTSSTTSDAALKGQYILAQNEPDSGSRARKMFDRALELDPGDAQALVGRGHTHLMLVGEGLLDRPSALAYSRRDAEAALALDPDNPQALALRGWARWLLDWDWEGAGRDLDRAVELAPEDAQLHLRRSYYLSASGRHTEALEEIELARRLAPTSPNVHLDAAWIYFYAQRFEQAIADSLRALELSPGYFFAQYCLAESYRAMDRSAEARIHLVAMTVAAAGDDPALAGLDELESAEQIDKASEWWAEVADDPARVPRYDRAIMSVRAGRNDEALRLLDLSAESLEPGVVMAAVDPRLNSLRADPRFAQFLQGINRD